LKTFDYIRLLYFAERESLTPARLVSIVIPQRKARGLGLTQILIPYFFLSFFFSFGAEGEGRDEGATSLKVKT
jgi:hypothetical protein